MDITQADTTLPDDSIMTIDDKHPKEKDYSALHEIPKTVEESPSKQENSQKIELPEPESKKNEKDQNHTSIQGNKSEHHSIVNNTKPISQNEISSILENHYVKATSKSKQEQYSSLNRDRERSIHETPKLTNHSTPQKVISVDDKSKNQPEVKLVSVPIYPSIFIKEVEVSPKQSIKLKPKDRESRASLQQIIKTKKECKPENEAPNSTQQGSKDPKQESPSNKEALLEHLKNLDSEELNEILSQFKDKPKTKKPQGKVNPSSMVDSKPTEKNSKKKGSPFYFHVDVVEEPVSQPMKVYTSENFVDNNKLKTHTDVRVEEFKKRAQKFGVLQNELVVSNGINGKVNRLIRQTNRLIDAQTPSRYFSDTMKYINLFYNMSAISAEPQSSIGYCVVHCAETGKQDYFRSIIDQNSATRQFLKPSSSKHAVHFIWSYRYDRSLAGFQSSSLSSISSQQDRRGENLGFVKHVLAEDKLPGTIQFIKDTKLFKTLKSKTGIQDCVSMIADKYCVVNYEAESLKISNHIPEISFLEEFDKVAEALNLPKDTLNQDHDKKSFRELLEINNLPKTINLELEEVKYLQNKQDPEKLKKKLNSISYPVILKKSHHGTTSIIAGDFTELTKAICSLDIEPTKVPDHLYPLPRKCILVQEVVPRPLLFNGYKFDMRCFVLVVKMFDTLTAYFYNEGIARLCSSLYDAKKIKNPASVKANRSTQTIGTQELNRRRFRKGRKS